MRICNFALFTIFLLVQVNTSIGDTFTAQLGDFIELHSSLRKCSASTKSKKIADFSKCTSTVANAGTIKIGTEHLARLCENKEAYFNCWNPVVATSRACNMGTNEGSPSVYKASLNAVCGTDNGKTNTAKFVKALNEVSTTECSASGDHWEVACAGFANEINSKDTCTRHGGLSKCVNIITCKERAAGRFLLEMANDAKKYIEGC